VTQQTKKLNAFIVPTRKSLREEKGLMENGHWKKRAKDVEEKVGVLERKPEENEAKDLVSGWDWNFHRQGKDWGNTVVHHGVKAPHV